MICDSIVRLALFFVVSASCIAQQDPRPPVILEHADSLVGVGTESSAVRKYEGNVRFRQGNVTVRCDRAIEQTSGNLIDLLGNVVVLQGGMELRAPIVRYDGNRVEAVATGGVVFKDGNLVIRSREGLYQPESKVATFTTDVYLVDDSLEIGADALRYHRMQRTSIAWGNAVISSRDSLLWMRGDSAMHSPTEKVLTIIGAAELWQYDHSSQADNDGNGPVHVTDSLYVSADTLILQSVPATRRVARGSAQFRRGAIAAKAATIDQNEDLGLITFTGSPFLWSDSTQISGDSLVVSVPNRQLRKIHAMQSAFMVSKSASLASDTLESKDSVAADRFDQVSGKYIEIFVESDTIRSIRAIEDTKSIYFRFEGDLPEGLAQFASDTLVVDFSLGVPEDIRWLGNVTGEQHPETVVSGKELSYRLSGFRWRTDGPVVPTRPTHHGQGDRSRAKDPQRGTSSRLKK